MVAGAVAGEREVAVSLDGPEVHGGWRRGTRAEAEALWQRMLGEGPANDGER